MPTTHLEVTPNNTKIVNNSIPPDEVWLWFPEVHKKENKTYSYKFHGEVTDSKNNPIDLKVITFFNCLVFFLNTDVCDTNIIVSLKWGSVLICVQICYFCHELR